MISQYLRPASRRSFADSESISRLLFVEYFVVPYRTANLLVIMSDCLPRGGETPTHPEWLGFLTAFHAAAYRTPEQRVVPYTQLRNAPTGFL